jgi:hypothetical protein
MAKLGCTALAARDERGLGFTRRWRVVTPCGRLRGECCWYTRAGLQLLGWGPKSCIVGLLQAWSEPKGSASSQTYNLVGKVFALLCAVQGALSR